MTTSTDSNKYLINGVEAIEGTPLTQDQLRAIKIDKVTNLNKVYPAWIDKEYEARKGEVADKKDKLIFAANKRVPSRSPHPPKTDRFAPKTQKEETEAPVLTPRIGDGPKYSDIIPTTLGEASANARIEANGSITRTTTSPTAEELERANQELLDRLIAGNTEEGVVNARTTRNANNQPAPTSSSAERSGTGG
jgi:hypothetical protein